MADDTRMKELQEAQRKMELLLVDERARRQAEGRAELWYQGHVEKRGEPPWSELIVAVLERFEDLDYERVVSEFNRVHQETTVNAYLERRVQAYDEENEHMEEQGGEAEIEDVTVSINAVHGNVSAGTLRVKGMVNGKEIHILIDSSSTHSFIDEKVVKALGIKVEPTTPMMVSVADGYRMISKVICPELSWEIQGLQFSYPVRTLKLGGCDFVLGCDWLGAYNPVELDFQQLTVTIN
ncbi:hypothetical protein Sango_1606200 [Sesamum angolense]|uniref:Uncharacterized protein n=1 Tax=Sesamum angolense TaxID=2727404 RepID=A0AAE2BQY6_9LAMI|nr:hypothetical protein Sango_1606200 [Sesamum angolense]